MKHPASAVCCLASALLATAAAAQPSEEAEICLVVRGCAAAIEGELLELLRLELQSEQLGGVSAGDLACATRAHTLWIDRACPAADSGAFEIGLSEAGSGRTQVSRRLRLDDVPASLWNRTLALAMAELFRAGTPEPPVAASSGAASDHAAAPIQDPPEPAPAARAIEAAPSAAESGSATQSVSTRPLWVIALGPAVHLTPGRGTALFGVDGVLHFRRLHAGVLATLGSNSDPLGQINYRMVHGYLAFDVLRAQLDDLTLAAGIRGAFGTTYASSTASVDAHAQDSITLSGSLALDLSVALHMRGSWLARLGLDLGYAAGPSFHADDRVVDKFSGPCIGASLSLGAGIGHER